MGTEGEHVVRVGPAGWSYDDWKGIVYPEPMPARVHALEMVCEWFDTVEINSSFYHPPNPRYAETWVRKVEKNRRFKFTAKLWERFTHKRKAWPSEDEIESCKAGLEPLRAAGLLGAVLVQFPWSFRRSPANRAWLERVVEAFSEYPLAIEVRHGTWDVPEFYEGLRTRRVALCNVDQPVIGESLGPSSTLTSPLGYVRFHGRNYDDWFSENAGRDARYNYLYSAAELAPWLDRLDRMRQVAQETYAITNNHYRGQAVVNAFDIEAGLGRTEIVIPRELIKHYPRLSQLVS